MSFYASMGTRIDQATAGVGELRYVMVPDEAYDDGSLGWHERAGEKWMGGIGEYFEDPGQPGSYRDGVFSSGASRGPGPLNSYRDGSLGAMAPGTSQVLWVAGGIALAVAVLVFKVAEQTASMSRNKRRRKDD